MSKQDIPPRKKYALWSAHEGICHYCKEPLKYQDVWIDHILPEHLLNTPDKFTQIIQDYELGADFDVRDYCNWLPSHWRCNLNKGGSIYDRGAARFYIRIAQSKVPAARKAEERIISSLKQDKLLGSLEIALDEGLLSKQTVLAILQQEATIPKQEVMPSGEIEPTVITFGLNHFDLLENESRPNWLDDYYPSDYPVVCDLLEKDLVKQLKSLLSCDFYYPEASERNGETLSVRLAFLRLNRSEISKFKSAWWEILEMASYSSIYGTSDGNTLN